MLESLNTAVQRVQALSAYATYKEKLTHTFGVVVECDAPRWTSGTDLIQTIRLVDESCPDGIALCIFGQQVDNMPRASLGDILELHNVIVQFWQDRPQLFAKMAKPHCFGYRLYHVNGSSIEASSSAQPVQQYNTTGDSRHAADRLPQLQALKLQALGHATAADATHLYLRRIRDLAPPDEEEPARPACVDMRVRVLAVDQRRASEEVVMYVWDATDARPVCASLQMLPSEWKGTQLRPAHPRRHVLPLVSEPPGLQVLAELPTIGTALPVVMDPAAVPTTGLPAVGDWVKVKVVGVAAVQGQWQVVFGKCSRLTQTQPSPAYESWYQTRLANNQQCEWPEDLDQVITRCSIPSLPSTTVRQVLLSAAQRQPGPFRVQLRLIGHLPQALQEWCKVRPQDGGSGQPDWEWAAHLWLEDATGEVRALLLGQEGTKLLGIQPQCLSSSPAALQQLAARLQRLASVDEGGGVWVDGALTPLYPAQQQQQGEEQQQQQQGQREQDQLEQQEREQQAASQQPQLQLVPYTQQLAPDTQEHVRQQQQQVVPLPAPVQPVFVLHDAVLIENDDLQEHEAGQQQQPGRQLSEEQLVRGDGGGQEPPGLLQLQHGSPDHPALEQQQQEETGEQLEQLVTGQELEQRQETGQQLEQSERRQQQAASRESTPGSSPGLAPHRQDAVGSKRRRRDSTGCAVG